MKELRTRLIDSGNASLEQQKQSAAKLLALIDKSGEKTDRFLCSSRIFFLFLIPLSSINCDCVLFTL